MWHRWLLGPLILLSVFNAVAQLADVDPDWEEVEVPAPPTFKTEGLVLIDMPRHVSTKIGLAPETLRIDSDGIIRYVMVSTMPSGSVNATYEGIRCTTAQVKTYALYGSDAKWTPIKDPRWKPLNGNQPSMHALAFARQAACDGRAATSHSPAAIISKLKIVPLDATRR